MHACTHTHTHTHTHRREEKKGKVEENIRVSPLLRCCHNFFTRAHSRTHTCSTKDGKRRPRGWGGGVGGARDHREVIMRQVLVT